MTSLEPLAQVTPHKTLGSTYAGSLGKPKWAKPALFFVGWALWLSMAYGLWGPHSYMRVHDNAESNLSFRMAAVRWFHEQGPVAWFPEFAAGIDAASVNTTHMLSYDFLPFLTLPAWLVYACIMFLQRFLAAYFSFKLCRDFLGLRTTACVLAGMLWSLAHWSTNDWTLFDRLGPPLIPFYLYLLEVALKQKGVAKYAWASLTGMLVSYFAFFALFTPYFIGGSLLWFCLVRRTDWKVLLPVYLNFGLVVLLCNVPFLLALKVTLPLSGRAESSAVSLSVAQALPAAWQGFLNYFMKMPLTWMVILLGAIWLKVSTFLFLRCALLAAGIAAGSGCLWFWSVTQRTVLGPLASLNFNDFILMALFLPSVAVACIVHTVLEERPKALRQAVVIGVLGICIWQSADVNLAFAERMSTDNFARAFQNPSALTLARAKPSGPFRVASVGLENSSSFQASGSHFYPNYAGAYGLEAVDGYMGLQSGRYQNFWGEILRPLLKRDEGMAKFWQNRKIWLYLFAPKDRRFDDMQVIPIEDYYNLDLLSLANTRYLFSQKPLSSERLTLKSEPHENTGHIPLYIYENLSVLPRAFIVGGLRAFQSDTDLLDAMGQASLEDLREYAYVTSDVVAKDVGSTLGFKEGRVTILQYGADRIELSVTLDRPGFLIVTNSYSPYWQAQVDQVPQEVVPVYHTFQGIYLDSGNHEVILKYQPVQRRFLRL